MQLVDREHVLLMAVIPVIPSILKPILYFLSKIFHKLLYGSFLRHK